MHVVYSHVYVLASVLDQVHVYIISYMYMHAILYCVVNMFITITQSTVDFHVLLVHPTHMEWWGVI